MVRYPALWPAVIAFGLALSAFVLWVPSLRAQLNHGETRAWIPQLTTYRSLFTTAYKLFVDPEEPPTEFGPACAGVVCAAFLAVAVWRGRWTGGVARPHLWPLVGAVLLCFERHGGVAPPLLYLCPAVPLVGAGGRGGACPASGPVCPRRGHRGHGSRVLVSRFVTAGGVLTRLKGLCLGFELNEHVVGN